MQHRHQDAVFQADLKRPATNCARCFRTACNGKRTASARPSACNGPATQPGSHGREQRRIILVGPHEQKTLDIVKASGVPIVRLGWVAPLEQADHVGGTDHEAGIAVGEYLVGLGHRDIAFLQGEEGYRGRMERYHGLRESLERYPDTRLHNLHFKEDGGFIPALRSLQATGIAPTALFCAHDGLALTAVSELLAWGYRLSSRCKSLDPLEWGMASHPAHD
ncbi:substrate-binding domain-containing protein [Rhizobium sp. WL3]|uniref:substrate-binding domain-containing protein n=1 Tax=Rhizobium sp. WL3 TaxID=2603277 RepID=UPI001FEF9706|nr:substrate-binding domain-containing protein [Rhizobium sp. WL3]